MLDAAPRTEVPGQIIGLVAPHAGYIYSGPIAAAAFRLVRNMSFERVTVISPMHSAFGRQPVMTTGHQAYQTPLGNIAVDHEALEALAQDLPIGQARHDPEHSLEIELPFLQRALTGDFRLIPLMLLDQGYPMAQRLGQALAAFIQADPTPMLLVASSDLSHFKPLAEAERLDKIMLDHIAAFDPESVIRAEEEGRAFACGHGAIATVLVAARELGATKADIAGYGTSAEASGDTHQVVGYGAAVIYKA
jgi:AmmeMemoRadiSam system protein B